MTKPIVDVTNSPLGANFVHTSVDIEKPAANLKYRWVVHDRYKLVAPWAPNLALPLWEGLPDRDWNEAPEIYGILADPYERSDLASQRPALVKTLSEELDQWWNPAADTLPPRRRGSPNHRSGTPAPGIPGLRVTFSLNW